MKKLILFVLSAAFTGGCFAQSPDSMYTYLQNTRIPPIRIMQTDSTWFENNAIPHNKPVVIVYFSPECGHCQLAAQEIYGAKDKLKKAFFIWTSYFPVPEIASFRKNYKIGSLPNFRFGRDPKYAIPSYFKVQFTPFMAVYDTEGKFVQAFSQGASPETLASLVEQCMKNAKPVNHLRSSVKKGRLK